MQLPILSFFDSLQDSIAAFIAHQGFLAPIIFLFIEEAGIPLPIADFVIAFTGYHVAKGDISFLFAFVILLIADLAGASVLYYLCSRYGTRLIDKFGKYIDLDAQKLQLVEKKFRKFGPLFIIFGRHIPGFRIPITVFSGISEVSYLTFIVSTFLSIVWWIPFYLSVGQRLGPKTIHLLHANKWYALLILLPLILSIAPFFFLRKKVKKE